MQPLQSEGAPIWAGQNNWSQAWEQKFSQWLTAEAQDPHFFVKIGVSVDCADVVYGLRWIFARQNDLKMAVHSHEGIFTNESENELWSHLSTDSDWRRDSRFLSSLDWVMRRTYTKSLLLESYPVEISADAFQAGTMYVNIENGHHAQIIVSTDYKNKKNMPLRFLVGTVPRSKNPLKLVNYWAGHQSTDQKSGFRKFLWPVKQNGVWSFTRPDQMPHYSLEQYDPDLMNGSSLTYSGYIYQKIKPNLNNLAKIERGLEELVEYIQSRVQIVEDGYQFCVNRPSCRDVASQDYDDWSTPSRDARIADLFVEVTTDVNNSNDKKANRLWKKFTENTEVFRFEGQPISLAEIYEIWSEKLYSSEPYDLPARRWGLQ
ncbi:MAG: hypothetical protein KDD38_01920 [Bdellovibrionales bacterium]|nr:hypothetical protein [Bdellovibrionales bacterium]